MNDNLLQGPDLTNGLVDVLTRFLKENFAYMADIEKMFYQVKVNQAHQDFLRFLWSPDADTGKKPEEYRMTVHLFGAVSSPGCANCALKRAADDGEEQFGIGAAKTVTRGFYVDDILRSVETEGKAIELIDNVKGICAKGGFNLTKFVSKSREVMNSIPKAYRAKEFKALDLGLDKVLIERALEIEWCVELDTIKFRIDLKDKPCTRRGVLHTVRSVYDPLGFTAPVVLTGKKILQSVSQCSSWDSPVPEDLLLQWERW